MPALAAAAFANAFGGAELGRTPCRPNTAAGDLAGARGVRRTIPSPWRGREKEEFGGGVTERLHPEENNACLPESKRQHTQTQMPAGSGSRRARKREWAGGAGGASPVWPGGSVADCQGPGGHPGAARIAPKEPRFRRGGGGRKRGICSSWEGGPRRKKEEKEEID